MNLEQAIKETSKRFSKLKAALQCVDCYLFEDLNLPNDPIRLMYANYSEADSYLSEEIEGGLSDLIKNIEVVKIFENNEKDTRNLIEWMIHELNFERFEVNWLTNEIPYQIDEDLLSRIYYERIKNFEEYRTTGHKMVVKELKGLTESGKENKQSRMKIDKLIWLGNQYQLVELFRTLIAKNWLSEGKTTPTGNARAILEGIDISLTKKKPDSNETESFIKSYLGEYDPTFKTQLYPGVKEFNERKNYLTSFDAIKENSKPISEKSQQK